MTTNVDDTFDEAGGNVLLTAHPANIGGAWVARDTGSGSPVPTVIGGGAGYAICNGGQTVVTNAAPLTSATDWSAIGYYDRLGGSNYPIFRVYGQMTAGGAGYMVWLNHYGDSIQLFKPTAWNTTGAAVDSFAMTLPSGASTLELKRVLLGGVPTIKVLLNGTERISFADSSPGSAPSNLGLTGWGWSGSGSAEGCIFRFTATSADPPSDMTGNVTLDAVVAAGSAGSSGSDLSGGVVLDAVSPAGAFGLTPGTVTLDALANENNNPHGAITIPYVTFSRLTDGVQVLVLAGVVLDGGGNKTITHNALVPGQWYVVTPFATDRTKAGVYFKQAV